MSVFALIATLAAAPAPAPPAAASTKADIASNERGRAEESLRRAINEYAYGNYGATIDQLRALLYPMRLYSDAQVIDARKYLGLSYYLMNRESDMREEFEKLLYLDPDYQLDPFSIPPPIIEAFEHIRSDMKPQLDVIRLRKSEAATGIQPGQVRRLELLPSSANQGTGGIASFMPFGVGQFENGDSSMGLFFALSEAALLGINIAAYLYVTYGIGNDYAASDHGLVKGLVITQYASLSLFAIMWGIGVYQARLQLTPQVTPTTQLRPNAPLLDTPRYHPTMLPGSKAGGLMFSLQF